MLRGNQFPWRVFACACVIVQCTCTARGRVRRNKSRPFNYGLDLTTIMSMDMADSHNAAAARHDCLLRCTDTSHHGRNDCIGQQGKVHITANAGVCTCRRSCTGTAQTSIAVHARDDCTRKEGTAHVCVDPRSDPVHLDNFDRERAAWNWWRSIGSPTRVCAPMVTG